MTLTTTVTGGTIVVTGPSGTVFQATAGNYVVTDSTTVSNLATTTAAQPAKTSTSTTNNKVTITPVATQVLAAGDSISIAISGVTNANVDGSYTLSVSTSTDLSPVTSSSYSLTGTPVATYAVATSNYGISGTATYSITGVTAAASLTGGTGNIQIYAWNATANDVAFPAGITNYSVADVTKGTSGTVKTITQASAVVSLTKGAYVEIVTPINITSGDVVNITISGMTNPSTSQVQQVDVTAFASSYSVPTAVAAANDVTMAIGTAVSGVTLGLSSSTAGATATYTVGLTATSALTASQVVTLTAPTGTTFINSGASVVDNTTSSGSGAVATITPGSPANTVAIEVPSAITKGDSLTFTLTGVTNPVAGSYSSFSVITAADIVPVKAASYTIAAASVNTISVALSDSTVGAASNWTISGFQAGTSGMAAGDTLTLNGPTGTSFPSAKSQYQLVDVTASSNTSTIAGITSGGGGNIVVFTTTNAIPANDVLQLVMTGVLNPTSAGSDTLTLVATTAGDIAYVTTPAPAATPPNAASTGSTGSLVNVNGTNYVYVGGVAFSIPTSAEFNTISAALGNPQVITATSVTTTGTVASGSLVQVVGSPQINVVGSNGTVYGFSTAAQFLSDGYSFANVVQVPSLGNLTVGSGTAPSAATTGANGALVNVSGTIYVYAGGVAVGIPTPAVFNSISAAEGNPTVVSASSVTITGTMATGTLVQVFGSPMVSIVGAAGAQTGFSTAAQFYSDGYSWSNVIMIP